MKAEVPAFAVIGGTGLSELFAGNTAGAVADTPYGATSGAITRTQVDDVALAFLPRHGHPHAVPPHKINYRANLWALHQLGVRHIIAINAVGGIRSDIATGALVIPDQIIDYTYGREHTYSDGTAEAELEHIDFSYPFDQGLRKALLAVVQSLPDIECVDGGVYGVTQGPRLETAAEINRMQRDGCDLVGMTAMPEAGLARELGLAYASLCVVVNPAAGRGNGLITMDDINRVVEQGMQQVRRVISAYASSLTAGA